MHRYWFLLRPPFIGTHPQGETQHKTIYPSEVREFTGGYKQHVFGWVEYSNELARELVWRYDLLPDDPTERAYYRMWLLCDRDDGDAMHTIDDYNDLSTEELQEQADNYNPYAAIVLDLRKADPGDGFPA